MGREVVVAITDGELDLDHVSKFFMANLMEGAQKKF